MDGVSSITPTVIVIDGKQISTRETFHDTFARVLNFPGYYGKNMDAWIDCMSEEISNRLPITIHLKNAEYLKINARQQFDDLIECAAFVNWRNLQDGLPQTIAFAFYE